MHGDPEFTGDKLHKLVIDIECAVGMNLAGMTPLGMAVTRLCEEAANNDPELKARDERERENNERTLAAIDAALSSGELQK